MCARRFLFVIFILILLAVAGAFAMFQFGGDVLLRSATPKGHFEAKAAGDAPDYAKNDAWLTRPGVQWPDNPADWTPAGVPQPPAANQRRAAVFYVHPTTYLERDRWNAPLRQDGTYADARTRLFLQSQASAFNSVGDIWAPRYRQAAYGAFLLDSPDARMALDLAYADVAAAFDRFLAESGDRPVILAGHSQGALHLIRLLKERVAGTPAAKRIVAAYVVGWPIDTIADLPALGLPGCAAASQTGCLLSWLSFGNPPNADLILDRWGKEPGLAGGKRRAERLVCVNPMTGSPTASASADNPGTLVPTADLQSASLEPGKVGARCDRGLLLIDGQIPPLGTYVLPGNNYHVYDFALFWAAIRRDAERRLAAWN